jgi:hypothetical protein
LFSTSAMWRPRVQNRSASAPGARRSKEQPDHSSTRSTPVVIREGQKRVFSDGRSVARGSGRKRSCALVTGRSGSAQQRCGTRDRVGGTAANPRRLPAAAAEELHFQLPQWRRRRLRV